MLRPCPVLDNYGRLAEMVEETGAKSTDLKCPENARDYCDKCKTAAEKWAPVADELWKEIDYKPITSGKLKPHKVM